MITKLFIISLLCASALSSGIMVLGGKLQTTDFFTCLRQTSPDFVMIAMDLTTQNWENFRQSHQNALDSGYTHVHVLIASWQPLMPGSLPKNFSGRVWITANAFKGKTYADIVTMVENIASQGYNAGILDDINLASFLTGVVPSVVSSLPFAFVPAVGAWRPFAGWQCPSIIVGTVGTQCSQLVTPLSVNPSCV